MCRLVWQQQRTRIKNEVPRVFEWVVLNEKVALKQKVSIGIHLNLSKAC